MRRIVPLLCSLLICVAGCIAVRQKPNEPDTNRSAKLVPARIKPSKGCRVDAIDGRPAIVVNYPLETMIPMVVVEPGKHEFTVRGPNHSELQFTAVVESDKDYCVASTDLGVTVREGPPLDGAKVSDAGSIHDSRARINDSANSFYSVVEVDGRPAICSSFRYTTMEPLVEVGPGKHHFTLYLRGQVCQVTATVEQGKEYCVDLSESNCWAPEFVLFHEKE